MPLFLRRSAVLAVLAILLLAGPSPVKAAEENGTRPLKKVRLMTAWYPQSQFAGLYVAQDHGFYRKHGLDVEIIPGGPDREQGQFLKEGRADYVISWLAPAMVNRDHGIPMVLVGQVMHRSNLAFVGWRKAGVLSLRDFQGRRVSLFEGWSRPPLYAFLRERQIDADLVPQYFTMELFLRRGVDVASVMTYNEYNMLYLSGIDPDQLTVIRLSDLGFVCPEDGIYTLEKTLESDPDTARALVAATREGWVEARRNPGQALVSVMRRVNEGRLRTNGVHMKMMLEEVLASVFPDNLPEESWGRLSHEDFEQCLRQMERAQMIRQKPAYDSMVWKEARNVP